MAIFDSYVSLPEGKMAICQYPCNPLQYFAGTIWFNVMVQLTTFIIIIILNRSVIMVNIYNIYKSWLTSMVNIFC